MCRAELEFDGLKVRYFAISLFRYLLCFSAYTILLIRKYTSLEIGHATCLLL